MSLSENTLDDLLNAATVAAYRAGARVMSHYGQSVEVGSKGREQMAGDVVTVADREAQVAILDVLDGIHPDIGILAEEEGLDADSSRFEKPYHWSIDPLDGTLPFIEQTNGFAVAIALVSKEGEAIMGVAYAPAFGDCYTAVKGQGAFKNGNRLKTSVGRGALHFSSSAADTIPPVRNRPLNHIIEGLEAHERIDKVAPILHGGAVVKGCWICECAPACYICIPRAEGGASVWDFAATTCIVKEAGGWVSDMFGNAPELNRRESTFMHHRGMLYASDEEIARVVLARYASYSG